MINFRSVSAKSSLMALFHRRNISSPHKKNFSSILKKNKTWNA